MSENFYSTDNIAEHTVNSYNKQLDKLTNLVVEMGKFTSEIINLANHAVNFSEQNHVSKAIEIDEKINQLDTKIEKEATTILALRQPVAVDLRHLTAALKISLILERMGDLSKDVTRKIYSANIKIDKEIHEPISIMTELVQIMLKEVLESFKNHDVKKAEQVIEKDEQVNEIYTNILHKLQKKIENDPKNTESLINVIFAAKRFERLGDYTTKIAKLVHYVCAGSRALNHT